MNSTEEEEEGSGPAQAEARQLMELVHFLARALGFNNSALARSANVPLATLVRYFKGEGEPKLEFLLSLVRALGLEVREFFELAYPEPAMPSLARLKIDKILQRIPGRVMQASPPPTEETAPLRREDIEQMLAELRQDMKEIVAEQEKRARAIATEMAARRRPRKS